MPSLDHEKLVEIFTRDPTIVVRLAEATGRLRMPGYHSHEPSSSDSRDLVSATLRVDVASVFRSAPTPENHEGAPVMALLLEVQLSRDDDKLYSWPFYAAAARVRLRCPVCLVVYAVSQDVGSWSSQAIDTGQPDSPFVPLVVGPTDVPRVTDSVFAKSAPYLAVLSALAHGRDKGSEDVAQAAWSAIEGFGEDERMLWLQVLLTGLNDAARKVLEARMNLEELKKQTPFFLEGMREGKLEGMREVLVDLCEVLGIELTEQRRKRLAELDLAELEAMRLAIKKTHLWPE